jgi:hypothetical protein
MVHAHPLGTGVACWTVTGTALRWEALRAGTRTEDRHLRTRQTASEALAGRPSTQHGNGNAFVRTS